MNIILDFIINFISELLPKIMKPIDDLFIFLLPNITEYIAPIENFFETSITYVGWFVDAIGIETFAIEVLISYFIFKLTVPLTVYSFKFVFRWITKFI